MKRISLFIALLILCAPLTLSAQKEVRQLGRKGNTLYEKQDYSKAEIEYRKALEVSPSDPESNYNLANTLYKTERGEEAVKLYQGLLQKIELLPTAKRADVAHNAGNVMMATQNYAQAVELYKESLRRRPDDDETRYNLALAQKLLEEQEQDGGGQDDNQEDDQDEQQEEQQEQEQQQDNSQNEQKPQDQPSEDEQMAQDNAEQILDAYLENEKETQEKIEKIKQQQQKGKRSRPKNW